jgi:hypothetical protein
MALHAPAIFKLPSRLGTGSIVNARSQRLFDVELFYLGGKADLGHGEEPAIAAVIQRHFVPEVMRYRVGIALPFTHG